MKRISTMELFEEITKVNEKVDHIETRLDSIESKLDAVLNGEAVKAPATKAPSKGKGKAKKSTTSSNNFDRKAYEAMAKKLGVWNEEYGKVTGTWKDGKKVVDAKTNRAKVYAAMGIK